MKTHNQFEGEGNQVVGELPIYNCHIHTFTHNHLPDYILNDTFSFLLGAFLGKIVARLLGSLISWCFIRPGHLAQPLILAIAVINSVLQNEKLQSLESFLKASGVKSQAGMFERIQAQYPSNARFVVLPMDMKYMQLGSVHESLDKQHADLLEIAAKAKGRVIPFYAADPRRLDLVQRVAENLTDTKFRGIKIYPNLGYYPSDPKLMDVYAICEERGYPVMTHCSPSGLSQWGASAEESKARAHPDNYLPILEKYPRLKLCLAHFGGSDEWERHLKGPNTEHASEPTWLKIIADFIRSGRYPNLYTDISYTIFSRKPRGLYIDYTDYLKVLLANQRLRDHILFGSDYYIVQREQMTEKQASLALRSRLGEDLFFKIAHYNPIEYLGIGLQKTSTVLPYAWENKSMLNVKFIG